MRGWRRGQQHYGRLLVWIACARVVFAVLPFGVQSNDGDVASTYASSMVYDPLIDRLYITGSSYGGFFDSQYSYRTKLGDRDCFLASLQLPTLSGRRGPIWLLREAYGSKKALEACSDVLLHRRDNARAYYLAAYSIASAGRADTVSNTTDNDQGNYGLLVDASFAGQVEEEIRFRSGAVEIPLSIATLDGTSDMIVATLYSSENFVTKFSAWTEDQHTLQPDPDIRSALLSSTQNFAYEAILRRFTLTGEKSNEATNAGQALELSWESNFTSANQTQSLISGIYVGPNGTLFVTGYEASATNSDGLIYNSFVRRIDAGSGKEIGSESLKVHNDSSHERALAICGDENSEFVYVVGIFDTLTSTGAFLLKLNGETLETLWTRELSALPTSGSRKATPQAWGLGCAVDWRGSHMFWAGTVKDGATISVEGSTSNTSSSGGDDIFTVKVEASEGKIVWTSQMGTPNDDTLATGRGIVSDREGNVIILGNTRGSFMREKSELGKRITNDVVVFSLNGEDGSHLPILDANSLPSTSPQQAEEGSESVTEVTRKDGQNDTLQNKIDQLRPAADKAVWSYPTVSPSIKGDDDQSSSKELLLVAIAVVTSLLICSFCGLVLVKRRRTIKCPPSCGASAHSDEKHMQSLLAHGGSEHFPHETRQEFTNADKICRSKHHGSRPVVEPDVDNYSSWRRNQLELDVRQESQSISPSTSDEATADVMRLLQEWKRQRGHPLDPSGVHA